MKEIPQVEFSLRQRDDGMWEARFDSCVCRMTSNETVARTSGSWSVASNDRSQAVNDCFVGFARMMLEPLASIA